MSFPDLFFCRNFESKPAFVAVSFIKGMMVQLSGKSSFQLSKEALSAMIHAGLVRWAIETARGSFHFRISNDHDNASC